MTKIDRDIFLRSFGVRPNGSLNFLLGAGTSVQANIPSAGTLVWQFKRKLFCDANNVREEKYKDLESERNRSTIQNFFELKGDFPKLNAPEEYSFYFEKCYPNSIDRKAFIQRIVQGKNPSIGHSCLGVLFNTQKVNYVWTTNFDELIECGIKKINNASTFEVISPENKNQIDNLNKYQRVIKLHGDYRYDRLHNSSEELQTLERELHKYFTKIQSVSGLIVIGYSGNDKSVLDAFYETVNQENPFPYGLLWCIRKGQIPNQNVVNLIEEVNNKSKEKLSGFIEIESFDEFLFELYIKNGIVNEEIENIAKVRFENRRPFVFPQASNTFPPVKFNGLKAKQFPKSVYSFKTDLKNWKELREVTAGAPIAAALSKGNTLAFANTELIINIFKDKLKSEIITVDIDDYLTYQSDSFFTGLLYDLIEFNLLSIHKLAKVSTSKYKKYYSTKHPVVATELTKHKIQTNISVYEAVEIQIEFHNKELFLILLPSVYILDNNGLSCFEKQIISNKILSNRRNKEINEKLKFWIALLRNGGESIQFSLDSFKIEFESNFSSTNMSVSKTHTFTGAFQTNEPRLDFHISDNNYRMSHPLKGLKTFGPLDYSFENNQANPQAIKLGILSPESGFEKILSHLAGLNENAVAKSEADYLIEYLPFSTIYKRYIEIPNNKESKFIELFKDAEVLRMNQTEFYDFLKRKIDYFYSIRGEFDVLVFYLPDSFKKFRELKNETIYFDLHDSIKIYCAKKNIKIQFIEDKSINYFDQAKVRWWLSLGLYVKANGTPWRNQVVNEATAFIGLDFAVQRTNAQTKYVLGSSQIFDSSGQSLRFLLQPIEHPVFLGKNPFMSREDARRLIIKLKEAYFRIDGNSKLEKLVIHKVLHFTNDEMKGISEAVEGIENIELLQIQKYSNWRAIRGEKNFNSKIEIHGYPIQRGTVIQLDDFSFLLWTHGSVLDVDVAGNRRNYYQSARGIPSPLLIRRFRGQDPIETTVREILALTKMNWNGGELYKTLPVTLDFSKLLSRYAKQAETLHAIPYDFRFIM